MLVRKIYSENFFNLLFIQIIIIIGFVVFAFIGYLSHTTGQEIDQVIQAGQGLSFIVYPYAG